MRILFIMLSITLSAALSSQKAFAVVDTGPDIIGIYFDLNAEFGDTFAGVNVPFNAYVLLTYPTELEIWGFEFSYSFTTCCDPANIFRLANDLPPQSIDLGDNSDTMSGEYVVGMAAPLPAAAVVQLVRWQFLLLAPLTIEMELVPTSTPSLPENVPAYEAGGFIVPLFIGGGCSGQGAAKVNTTCGLPVEVQSFGKIKALYR